MYRSEIQLNIQMSHKGIKESREYIQAPPPLQTDVAPWLEGINLLK